MKTFEFQTTLTLQDSLPIPAEVAAQLSANQVVKVVLLVADSDEDVEWANLTHDQFLQGYDPGDAIYDVHAG